MRVLRSSSEAPGGVEPGVAKADELAGGDGEDDGGVVFGGFGAGWVGEGIGREN